MSESFCELRPLERVKAGDIEIAYKSFGSGEPLVMITGYIATMELWDPLFVRTLAEDHMVVIFDNRGTGETTGGTAEWTIDQFADDTAGLIEALGLQKANVLGWSMGGDIALGLAVRHPDKVSKLVVYAGDCGGPEKVDPPGYLEILKEYRDVHAHFKRIFATLFPGEWMEEHPDYWKSFQVPCQVDNPLDIIRQNNAYKKWPGVYRELSDIRVPVLVVTGDEDLSTPPENADILAERISGARLVRFAGAGHGLQYQYPKEFAKVVARFLDAP